MKKLFNNRSIISIMLLVSLVMMPITAVFTHVTHGFSISHFWLHIHILFGVLFMIFGIMHVVFNWRMLKNYVVGKKK